jgi:hypothetical protein
MSHFFRPLYIVLAASVLFASITSASAANRRTWVSGAGSDAGGCTITAPCQTFQFAQSKTSDGGTINVLAPGDFGPVTITQSLNIVADGVEGYIFAINVNAITMNTAGIEVSLRGLTIDVMPNQNFRGIAVGAQSILRIENTTIRGGLRGIDFGPGSGASQLHILNSTITSTTSDGLAISNPGGPVSADIQGLRVRNTGNNGILISGQVKASIRDSVLTDNVTGLNVGGSAMSPTNVMLSGVRAVNNSNFGIRVNGATVRMGESVVSGNGTGLSVVNGGTLASYKTSQVNGNSTDGNPTGAAILLK